jgi:hypothetical protein
MQNTRPRLADIELVEHWPGGPDGALSAALVKFWLDEKALPSEADGNRRLSEVVLHARDAEGAIAGVCTAAALMLPRLGEPMYYYRCLVGSQWRSTALVMTMLKRAWTILEEYAVAHDYPCIGVVLELENDQFSHQLDSPVWPSPEQRGFVYIGKSRHGLDLRIAYFRGSRLRRQGPVNMS